MSMFSQIVAAKYRHMAHLTSFRANSPPNCRVNKIARRLPQKWSFLQQKQESEFLFNNSSTTTYILQLFVVFDLFRIFGKEFHFS